MSKKTSRALAVTIHLLAMAILLILVFVKGEDQAFQAVKILLILVVSLPPLRLMIDQSSPDEEKLIEKIYFDNRTGLPNREKLRLDALQHDAVLFLLNIDSFKEVNDLYGNPMGDEIIQSLARRLQEILHGSYARLFEGGELYKLEIDEFAYLFNFEMEDSRISRTAEVILEQINDFPFLVENTEITITITLGIASRSDILFPVHPAERTPGILAQADMAMKRAKERRIPFLVYTHTMNIPREYEDNIRWTHQVKQSIRNDQVMPFYQPIFCNESGKIEKFECLMRIVDGDENIIYPEQFLKISKRSRQYPMLSRIMLRKIIREMKKTDYSYAFNISVEDMQNRRTVGFIRTILSSHPEEAKRITFEILESENIEGIPEVPDFVRMVKEFGSSIALDDFGTGYSNFSYTLALDVDYIKIDASIIRNLDSDENAVAIAETIIGFAKRTGKKTIAEFVHSESILELVKEMGVDYSQGYYLGKPRRSSETPTRAEEPDLQLTKLS